MGLAAGAGLAASRPAPPGDAALADAARRNEQSLTQLSFAPFRRAELGWEVYEPLIAHEIGATSDPGSPGFARSLAAWQARQGLRPTGVMDPATFTAMEVVWQGRRPFVAASKAQCPPSPPETSLATIPSADAYGGKVMLLRPGALAAYQSMAAAARAATPALKADKRLLTIFSAYRSADSDAARCARENNCQGVVRASCSAHLTGLAIDVYLGAAPGLKPESSDDANRLFISRGPAYRWMVANASRFGFVPYPFEPWHWEWTGEPV
jgi:hypothetical protein